jgi:hypothetical protein
MATRQERIDAFTHQRVPPADLPLELLCEDHVGTYVIPFLCRWSSGAWYSVETGRPIEADGRRMACALMGQAVQHRDTRSKTDGWL